MLWGYGDTDVHVVRLRCPSRIWHSFCWAKVWNTGPNCRRMFPRMAFRRLLGTNTTWYLQSHFEWARL